MAHQATFPAPVKLSPGSTRWRLTELAGYEAALTGTAPAQVAESYLTVAQVAKRYGVSVATIWRWSAAGQSAAA